MTLKVATAIVIAAVVLIATTQPEACGTVVPVDPVPVESAPVVLTPTPAPTAKLVAFPVPTAVSGAELVWPKLHLGETGTVSHYGSTCPRCVALPFPWGPGWKVTIAGPGGTWKGVSNDMGPDRSLHRVADLGVPIWEQICGVPASMGLCTATVTVTGKVK